MNILVILAAVSVAVYGETCDERIKIQYRDEIELKSCEACIYTSLFVNEAKELKKSELISKHKNDKNYKLRPDVSLNVT